MYPGTILNYIDNSILNDESEILLDTRSPLWLVAAAFPKGPEKLTVVDANNFYQYYGDTADFAKYGQAVLQARNIVDNGGRLWVKRLLPEAATFGNLYYTAKVEAGTEDVPVKITWKAKSVEGLKSYDEFKATIDAETDFVPFAFIDNGRGGSVVKSVRFVPDYNISRNSTTTFYNFEIYEGGRRVEHNTVTADPSYILNGTPYRLSKDNYAQIDAYAYEDKFDKFIDAIYSQLGGETSSPYTKAQIRSFDLLFGYNNRGEKLDKILSVPAEGTAALNTKFGTTLANGDDGWSTPLTYMHDTPKPVYSDDVFNNQLTNLYYDNELVELMKDFYENPEASNNNDELIYDVDSYRLFGIADANYPFEVKQAITNYVVFRNDCFFFRDLCIINDDNFGAISARATILKDEFASLPTPQESATEYEYTFAYADYCTTYDIIDPETRIRERVTMMYDLVSCLTRAYINRPFSPNAGTYNGYILESAVIDSLNFVPLKTPKVNYKQSMDDLRINYAIFEDNNNLVVQSLYTKNRVYSQLSYINNVLSMQEIGRRVAMVCPAVRYSLQMSGDDVSNYTSRINGVLENYASSFDKLELVYSADEVRIAQKIFYASIQFSFANWYQTEIFDLVANPTTILSTEEE